VNIDVMLRAADAIRGMFDDIDSSNDVDISVHLADLQQVVGSVEAGDAAADETTAEPEASAAAEPTTETESAPAMRGAEVTAKLLATLESEANDSSQATTKSNAQPTDAGTPPEPTVSALPKPAAPAPAPAAAAPTKPPAPSKERRPASTGTSSSSPVDTSIRVSVQLLDSLMNLAGELVLSRNQLIQKVSSDRATGLDSVAARVDQITSELQEAIMQTRMQVVGTVFSKFPRVVRDLSNQLGKKSKLILEGEDVELDKSIIEAISDPLTHLIRNSADHGIEMPDQRIQAGKPATGTIVLKAFHQAGKVNLSISDDGAGINAEKLKEKAISRGILTPEDASELTEREAVRLIFHPGFSMAEQLTGVSGRGVGMDVVRTNIEKLGGTIGIDTEVGVGTTINVQLPLTLAIVPSLIVRCGARRFALPQTNIRELVRIRAKDVATSIERVKSAEVFRLRGTLLPLVRLDTALGIESTEDQDDALNIIVVEAGHQQYGLIVDGLHDSEEIVVKPLGRHMQECQTFAGATILGDGQVALILDVASIASYCQLTNAEEEELAGRDKGGAAVDDETQTSLLFTNHPDEPFGVPMEAISRLERIRVDQIDSYGGMKVLQYRGESLPLLALEDIIKACDREKSTNVYVVVFTVMQREVGLIVPNLVDIRRIDTQVDTVTFREPGVVGSVEVDNRATRLLDLYELTKRFHPEWFRDADESRTTDESVRKRILLAEDSTFFLRQVTGFLEEAGYEIVGCEDGLVAWNTLQERGHEIDMIVTDIEMPNMDGCQLARRIKDDPNLCHLPVVALTSLSGEEDMQRGLEAGIDDYQVKMDRERLITAVDNYLRSNKVVSSSL
jgi:two-component system chemotaxis sensor kinase CheA